MNQNDREQIRTNLNDVGKGFCLAKWYELDLDLSRGKNRSCDLVDYHSIPIDDLRSDLNLFHNTDYKKVQRFFMLEGIQPKECKLCWDHESVTKKESPRLEKSIKFYDKKDVEKIVRNGHSYNYFPRSLKIIFSRNCNFKCLYCGPMHSSSWARDIFENGSYPINSNQYSLNFLDTETVYFDQIENPYIEYFWLWFVNASNKLENIYISGGEPVMDKNFFRILEHFIRSPNKKITIEIESNTDPAGDRWNGFIDLMRKISKNTNKIVLHSSIDCWGEQAEYIRNGLSISKFKKNIIKFLKSSNNKELNFKINFNCLCYESFLNLIKEILELRKRFASKNKLITFQVSVCQSPIFFHPSLFKDLTFHIDETLKFMKSNLETIGNKYIGFSQEEIESILQLKDQIIETTILEENFRNFFDFIKENDLRNNKSFKDVFPNIYDGYLKNFKYEKQEKDNAI